MTTMQEYIASLPKDRQAKIEARRTELLAKEMSLRELRKALGITQEIMAKRLGKGQDAVSKIEKRTDMLVSTLFEVIDGMGGQLELIARFPDGAIRLEGLGLGTVAASPARPMAPARPAPTAR